MKFSFSENDVTTYWDEIVLGLITLAALVIGLLLVIVRPRFWIIPESISVCIGIAAILLAVMYIPCIIYRLFENKLGKK